ncbi:MAG: AI-2E family transporter [Patescibacteria group bacterium]|nr:AI-2E family transporter [Patescibacteria group bacterium]
MTVEKFPHSGQGVVGISTMTIIKVALVALTLVFLWIIRDILAIFFVALILAALIDPFADWFQRHRIPRSLAVIFIYVVLLALLAVILFLLIPPLVEEIGQLAANFEHYWEKITSGFNVVKGYAYSRGIESGVERGLVAAGEWLTGAMSGLFGTITGFFGGLAAIVLILVLTFYMVAEESSAKRTFHNITPVKYQPYVAQLISRMKVKIGLWLRGQILISFLVGLLVYIALTILGVHYALMLALIAAAAEFVPYLGPVLASVPAIFLAFVQSPVKALLVLIVYILIQQLENNVLTPKITQKTVGLNPIVSIAALLIGAKLGGIAGAILAIPIATVVSVFIQDMLDDWSNDSKRKDA